MCVYVSATRYPNSTYCPPFLFECKNHVCVQPHWRCDGDNDCGDNSDEELHLCCKKKHTHINVHLKRNSHVLTCTLFIYQTHLCFVLSVDIPCDPPFRFRCDNNRCIYSHEVCNSIDDCGDGTDERAEHCE